MNEWTSASYPAAQPKWIEKSLKQQGQISLTLSLKMG